MKRILQFLWLILGVGCALLGAAQAAGGLAPDTWPQFALVAEQFWQLNLPHGERFDASGLTLLPDGGLLTINDHAPGIWRIRFLAGTNAADLERLPNCFTDAQLAPFAKEKVGRWDCEGLARDAQGRLYVCEEANRWIMRFDPKTEKLERLPIDWSWTTKYFNSDPNASFEGVAIGGGKLFVANERQLGRLIVVDLATLKVERDFAVHPANSKARDPHYSDLCWHGGHLWVLMREARVVLQVDAEKEKVLAQFSFSEMERKMAVAYNTRYPTSTMEGLAVDDDFIWLCTDNNGEARWIAPGDTRPTLFKCKRPDVKRKE
ncbi:MAG: esterase-like activity of phytase family protein [Verrucomicrobia bacterium]|nr:esterase-like activity of phytase family protein [Verrucomicrobiota bacterium]